MSPAERRAAAAHRAAQPRAGPRQPPPAQARRPRRRLGHRQDLRPRPEGRGLALGLQAPRALRGRPDADPHAHAKAARPAHEEVDAVRALPHAHPAGQHLRAGEPLRRGHRGDDRADEGQRPGHAQGRPRQGARQGRAQQGADRARPRLQRRRARAHRGGRRHLHASSRPSGRAGRATGGAHGASTRIGRSAGGRAQRAPSARTQAHALDDPQRLPGRGHPQEDRLHGGDAADLPLRLAHPRAGRQPDGGQQHPEAVRRLEHPRPAEPLLRRRAVADRDLRAGHHALHHRLDHPAAAAGGGALAGKALQGRRGRAGADHPVHALPDRRPGLRPVDRLRLPVPHAAGQSRRIGRHALRRAAHLPDRRSA